MFHVRWCSAAIGVAACVVVLAGVASAQDWPQWRGPHRDARASGFHAPASWPKELTQKWRVPVGNSVSTPAIVGDRVYVHARQDDEEIVRCLNAATGEEIWQDSLAADAPTGGASGFPGPRSSPAVADGKVVTLGVQGTLCCYDAATGKQLWRKDEFGNDVPMFFVSSSPIIVGNLCIAQLGGRDEGGVVAFDLASGNVAWRWTDDAPAYGSLVLMQIGDVQFVVAPMDRQLVALAVADGKPLWELPFSQGRYNSATPIVDGDVLLVPGPEPGISAFRLKVQDGKLVEEKLWTNGDNTLQFNTPALTGKLLVGLSGAGQLFCINTENPTATAWTAPLTRPSQAPAGDAAARGAVNSAYQLRALSVQDAQPQERERERGGDRRGFDRERRRGPGQGGFGGGRFGGRGGGRGRGGYGSVVDAGSALLALSPAGELVVFQPSDAAFSEVARYKVAEEGTYAYPVAVGHAIYIKDGDSLTRWAVE